MVDDSKRCNIPEVRKRLNRVSQRRRVNKMKSNSTLSNNCVRGTSTCKEYSIQS
ncbi:hypothetical protein E2C01_013644 [Portunus trituberculatus]|uniref:Uncharacterized protein n=1 Tax=Portunus trituberculatus TaxID=210409 RepID=A0A5B7DH76_PORTR|nr:hypothetical protein [Portunus trituberculatus]